MNWKNLDNWKDMPLPAAQDDEYTDVAWGLNKAGEDFVPIKIARANCRDGDVRVELQYCGICHTDVHVGLNQLGGNMYPCVPGHELVGVVAECGKDVTKVKVGDNVGIGCLCDSCGNCAPCKAGDEQYCEVASWCHIYGDMKKYGHIGGNQAVQTLGGYSGSHCLPEHWIIKIPDGMPLDKAAPLLCAGVTMYDPLKHWGATKQDRVMNIGIVGIGGLGTMGLKLAKAMGHRVIAISHTPGKEAMAKEKGADAFVVSSDPESVKAEAGKCDIILNTLAAKHEVGDYLGLLAHNGTIVQLGVIADNHAVCQLPLIFGRKSVAGSLIGGVANTEECLAFCQQHNILPDIQVVEADKIGWVFNQLSSSNADGIRYVLDIKKSKENKDFMPK
jgi:uncharacterized zinc-type alcohol dehydrogenase-like protein